MTTDQELIERRGCPECNRLREVIATLRAELKRRTPTLKLMGIAYRLLKRSIVLQIEGEELAAFVMGLADHNTELSSERAAEPQPKTEAGTRRPPN